MREQAAALDEQPGGRREQHDPAGVGLAGDQDFAMFKARAAGIEHHAHAAGDATRAGPGAAERSGFLDRRAGVFEMTVARDRTACEEAVGRGFGGLVFGEFRAPQLRQFAEISPSSR